ncbi:MAG: hypothetical protein OEU36_08235 [Gammaproteobacteria bacterium]|nr:hypothetical protein [Gammaproteobacteria bacterium]
MNIKALLQTASTVVFSFGLLVAGNVSAITKCQDAEGKWHYGDYADEECAASGLHTEIDENSGLKLGEEGPPPTAEETKAEEDARAAQEAAERAAAEQKAREDKLLSIYESEQSIITARDTRLESVDNMISINNDLRQGLVEQLAKLEELRQSTSERDAANELDQNIAKTHAQIAEYDAANKAKLAEREEIERKYNLDLANYRKIIHGGTGQEDG